MVGLVQEEEEVGEDGADEEVEPMDVEKEEEEGEEERGDAVADDRGVVRNVDISGCAMSEMEL